MFPRKYYTYINIFQSLTFLLFNLLALNNINMTFNSGWIVLFERKLSGNSDTENRLIGALFSNDSGPNVMGYDNTCTSTVLPSTSLFVYILKI